MRTILLRFTLPVIFISLLLILMALTVGDHLPGQHIAAFTTNTYQTRSMYVSDIERGMNFFIELHGHESEVPTWSRELRGVVFYPR